MKFLILIVTRHFWFALPVRVSALEEAVMGFGTDKKFSSPASPNDEALLCVGGAVVVVVVEVDSAAELVVTGSVGI